METFYINPATENEIAKIISNLNDSASGWGNLSPAIIKTIKQHIKQPITHICNLSFTNGYFPCEMKLAKVIPIFKNGDKHLFQNYRPVSVLPCLSKIFERLIYNRLVTFIEKHKLIDDLQFGFRKDRSAYMALIEAVDIVTNALDRGETVVGVSLDLSKAFDTVNHMILMEKCDKYGIMGVAKEWPISYLNGRKQYVSYNGIKSNKETISYGVPQGSILGPLLFLIYINDLTAVSKEYRPISFADDTNIFYVYKNKQTQQTYIRKEMEKIQTWMNCNELSLNLNKSQYMIYCPTNKH